MAGRLRSGHAALPALLVALALPAPARAAGGAVARTFSGATMGTTYTVKVVASAPGPRSGALATEIDEAVRAVDERMSTYRTDSELSRLNRNPSTDWIPVSSALRTVVDAALAVSRLSRGAYDVTVGPLVDLWGFGPPGPRAGVPGAAEIAERLARVGFRRIETRPSPPAIRKIRAEVRLDLSSIAKGYAVDRVAALLAARGVASYLVEIGGELKGRGRNPAGAPWRVGIEDPAPGRRRVRQVVRIGDQGMATSGSYRNFFRAAGKTYSHTIDPRTGRPVTHRLAAVTVLDPSAMRADALATALMVLGPEAGYALARREGLPAYFVVRTPSGDSVRYTPELAPFLE